MRTSHKAPFAVSATPSRARGRWLRAPVCRARRFGYSNDAAGRRTAISRSGEAFGDLSGAVDAYGYNLRSEVVSARRTKDGAPVRGFDEDFSYDPIGNRIATTNYTETGAAVVSEYAANNLNQYTSRTVPGVAAVRGFADADATVTVNENPAYRLGEYFYGSDAFDNSAAPINAALVTTAALASPTNGPDEVASVTSHVHFAKTPQLFEYDLDGNLLRDGKYVYSYDAGNRLIGVMPQNPVDGDIEVQNSYDYRHRRIGKMTRKCNGGSWNYLRSSRFIYDKTNVIDEHIDNAYGLADNVTYLWGKDISGSLNGAGGVGGLLCVGSENFTAIPCADANGNIKCYLDVGGDVVASYEYDTFGKVVVSTGRFADNLDFGFSSKYHDREVGMTSYQRRFYCPDLGRWLNRDPIEEEGGENLYAFCLNNAIINYDKDGCAYFAIRGLGGGPIIKWSRFFTCPFMKVAVDLAADALNVELVHEQLCFEDGGDISSIGWGKDGNADYLRNESSQGYTKRDGGYDDCIMRIAVGEVNPDHYQLTWIGANKKCNCQDYASALRAKYRELSNDPKVKCKCKKGK